MIYTYIAKVQNMSSVAFFMPEYKILFSCLKSERVAVGNEQQVAKPHMIAVNESVFPL